MLPKINAERLLLLMQNADWHKELKKGYEENEPYYEFGILPLALPYQSEQGFLLLLNHHLEIYFTSAPTNKGDLMVRGDDNRAGEKEETTTTKGQPITICYLSQQEWQICCAEAAQIRKDYEQIRDGFFLSIPNKWYEQSTIIAFVDKNFSIVPRPIKSRFPYGSMEN